MQCKIARSNFRYQPRYGVIVLCKTEEEQKETYARLSRLGLRLKVVCV